MEVTWFLLPDRSGDFLLMGLGPGKGTSFSSLSLWLSLLPLHHSQLRYMGERNELPWGSVLVMKNFKSVCCGLGHHQIRWLDVSWLEHPLLTMRVSDLFIFDMCFKNRCKAFLLLPSVGFQWAFLAIFSWPRFAIFKMSVFLLEWWNVLDLNCSDICTTLWLYNNTELYTSERWILWYVDYVSV